MAKTPGVPHAFGCFFVFYPCVISLDMSYKFKCLRTYILPDWLIS